MKKSVSFIVAILTLAMLVATAGCTSNKPDLSAQDYNQQGISLANQGKYKDAVASYTRAIQLNSQEAQFYVNRGTAYLNMKEFDLAIADFDQAIELDPNLAEAYAGRGYAYMNKGGVYLNLAIADFNIVLLKSKDADLINYAKQMLENLTKTPPFLAVIPLPPVIIPPSPPKRIDGTQEGNVTPPDRFLPSIKDSLQSSTNLNVVFSGSRIVGSGSTIDLAFGNMYPFDYEGLSSKPLSTDDRKETSTGIVWQGNSFSIKNERLDYLGGFLYSRSTLEISGTVSDDWRQILNVRLSGYRVVLRRNGEILDESTMKLSAVNIPLDDKKAMWGSGTNYYLYGPQVQGHIVEALSDATYSKFSDPFPMRRVIFSLSDVNWNDEGPSRPTVSVSFFMLNR